MKTESLISFDDLAGGPPALEHADPDRSYTNPGYKFRGRQLHPYSHGIDLLHAQVTDFATDTQFYHWVSFLFLLLVRDPRLSAIADRKQNVLPLAWDVYEFRAALVEWLDEMKLTAADTAEAERLFLKIRAEADGTSVETVGGRKKKAGGAVPTETAFLIATLAGQYTKDEILWAVPKAELNQAVHVHLFTSGTRCRRLADKAAHYERLDRAEDYLRKLGLA